MSEEEGYYNRPSKIFKLGIGDYVEFMYYFLGWPSRFIAEYFFENYEYDLTEDNVIRHIRRHSQNKEFWLETKRKFALLSANEREQFMKDADSKTIEQLKAPH